MAMLTAREVNMLKALLEGGAGEHLYARLRWGVPKCVRFSSYERDLIGWHLTENAYLTDEEYAFLRRLSSYSHT